LNALVASLILILTVVVSLALGVMTASWLVQTVLFAFGHRPERQAPQVLIPSQTHGD
jgi:hypothetical protein